MPPLQRVAVTLLAHMDDAGAKLLGQFRLSHRCCRCRQRPLRRECRAPSLRGALSRCRWRVCRLRSRQGITTDNSNCPGEVSFLQPKWWDRQVSRHSRIACSACRSRASISSGEVARTELGRIVGTLRSGFGEEFGHDLACSCGFYCAGVLCQFVVAVVGSAEATRKRTLHTEGSQKHAVKSRSARPRSTATIARAYDRRSRHLDDPALPLLITGVAGVAGYNALDYFQAKYPGQVIGIRQEDNWPLTAYRRRSLQRRRSRHAAAIVRSLPVSQRTELRWQLRAARLRTRHAARLAYQCRGVAQPAVDCRRPRGATRAHVDRLWCSAGLDDCSRKLEPAIAEQDVTQPSDRLRQDNGCGGAVARRLDAPRVHPAYFVADGREF